MISIDNDLFLIIKRLENSIIQILSTQFYKYLFSFNLYKANNNNILNFDLIEFFLTLNDNTREKIINGMSKNSNNLIHELYNIINKIKSKFYIIKNQE